MELEQGFGIAFHTTNDAFKGDQLRPEVARIVRGIADEVEKTSSLEGTVRDANGNAVGSWFFDNVTIVEEG